VKKAPADLCHAPKIRDFVEVINSAPLLAWMVVIALCSVHKLIESEWVNAANSAPF
jgi:hypothetical protein